MKVKMSERSENGILDECRGSHCVLASQHKYGYCESESQITKNVAILPSNHTSWTTASHKSKAA